MKLVHSHCDFVVDTGPWEQDLMDILEGRRERWQQWLTQHGYEAGRHYWTCKQGYRFSSGGIATAFVLGVAK